MTKLFIAAALVASSLPALADGTKFDNYPPNIASTVTRAEVIAELARARANGELAPANGEHPSAAMPVQQALSRAEVIADQARARANGELN